MMASVPFQKCQIQNLARLEGGEKLKSAFCLLFAYNDCVSERWCIVTVTDQEGRRRSLDVLASSTYHAAHQYVAHVKNQAAGELPVPTLATVFEVVAHGKVHRIAGRGLQRWIVRRRHELNGPKVFLFSQRLGLE